MATRKTAWHPDKVRRRIQASQLINRLRDHALGSAEMSATQIKAAEILLKKAIPDLKGIEHTGIIQHRHATELSDAELSRIATGGSAGAPETANSPQEPPGVH